jgi:hypothetical protein
MPTISLDLGGVGELPEEGVYRIVCDKAVYKQNKSKDGWIGNLQMHLVDMDDENFENFKVFDNISFKPTALWRTKEVLEAFTNEEWAEDGMEIDVDDEDNTIIALTDKTCLCVLYHEEYNGKPQARVKSYLPDNGEVEIGPSKSL